MKLLKVRQAKYLIDLTFKNKLNPTPILVLILILAISFINVIIIQFPVQDLPQDFIHIIGQDHPLIIFPLAISQDPMPINLPLIISRDLPLDVSLVIDLPPVISQDPMPIVDQDLLLVMNQDLHLVVSLVIGLPLTVSLVIGLPLAVSLVIGLPPVIQVVLKINLEEEDL